MTNTKLQVKVTTMWVDHEMSSEMCTMTAAAMEYTWFIHKKNENQGVLFGCNRFIHTFCLTAFFDGLFTSDAEIFFCMVLPHFMELP